MSSFFPTRAEVIVSYATRCVLKSFQASGFLHCSILGMTYKHRDATIMRHRQQHAPLQIHALNRWLSEIFGQPTDFADLLAKKGFNKSEIEYVKQHYSREFLPAIIELLWTSPYVRDRRGVVLMIRHYGFEGGEMVDYYTIAPDFGVCGERIRQLVTMQMQHMKQSDLHAQFKDDLTSSMRRLLDARNECDLGKN